MPMGSGHQAGQERGSISIGAVAGARTPGGSLLQHNSPHHEQQLAMPTLEKRPSDLLHQFAQVIHSSRELPLP